MTAEPVLARRLRWGIVGTGHISQEMAADFARVAEAEVVAVSSRRESSAAAFADEFGIEHRFSDFRRMLDAEVDAVYIGTPHATHFELAKQALLSGRHVLCEKPISTNAREVRELAEIGRASGAFLMEAMWMKFNPLHQRLLELVREGAIGEVRSVRASFGAPFPEDGSSRWSAELQGSTLLDQGIYPITLAHMLLGEPSHISAAGVMRDDGVDLSEHFTLDYPHGRFAQGAASMVDFLDMAASVAGKTGWITIDAGFWYASSMAVHTMTPNGAVDSRVIETERDGFGYTPMLREVTRAIQRGWREHPLHTMDAAAAVFDSMDEIRRLVAVTAPTLGG